LIYVVSLAERRKNKFINQTIVVVYKTPLATHAKKNHFLRTPDNAQPRHDAEVRNALALYKKYGSIPRH